VLSTAVAGGKTTSKRRRSLDREANPRPWLALDDPAVAIPCRRRSRGTRSAACYAQGGAGGVTTGRCEYSVASEDASGRVPRLIIWNRTEPSTREGRKRRVGPRLVRRVGRRFTLSSKTKNPLSIGGEKFHQYARHNMGNGRSLTQRAESSGGRASIVPPKRATGKNSSDSASMRWRRFRGTGKDRRDA